MKLRFWNDPETGLPHMYDHGVTEEEVREVLGRPGEECPGSDESLIRLGQTAAGRNLQVIYVPNAGRESAFVVTPFDMTVKAKRAFRKRRRRKQ